MEFHTLVSSHRLVGGTEQLSIHLTKIVPLLIESTVLILVDYNPLTIVKKPVKACIYRKILRKHGRKIIKSVIIITHSQNWSFSLALSTLDRPNIIIYVLYLKAGKKVHFDKVKSSIYEVFISVILFMSSIFPGEIGIWMNGMVCKELFFLSSE